MSDKIVVFQTDSEIVNRQYADNPNYLVEFSTPNTTTENYCILYFSSNDIYYPNTEEAFKKQLLAKNRYEWYGQRIAIGSKHIFIRDIQKQWYLKGINSNVNSLEKLTALLKEETKGYKIIALGSSAGGYAAAYVGSQLGADRILCFNAQFQIGSLLETTTEFLNPVLFRERNNPAINRYFSLRDYVKGTKCLYYFYSDRSSWDVMQYEHIKGLGVKSIPFRTSHHGIPFLKSNLKYVINLSSEKLDHYVGKVQHPLLFSFKVEGVVKTFLSIYKQVSQKIIRKYFNKV